jgi:hypothetical protein
MCILTNDVRNVSSTVIVAGKLVDGRQRVLYGNTVDTDGANMMVLPVPSVGLPDLVHLASETERLPQEVRDGFAALQAAERRAYSDGIVTDGDDAVASDRVAVVRYGAYDVSVVDEARLASVRWDVFGASAESNAELQQLLHDKYPGHAFILAKMHPGEGDAKTPICWEYVPSPVLANVLPTYHVHLGAAGGRAAVAAVADWDHHVVVFNGLAGAVGLATSQVDTTDVGARFPVLARYVLGCDGMHKVDERGQPVAVVPWAPFETMCISAVHGRRSNVDLQLVFNV